MKVQDLLMVLSTLPPNKEIVVQVGHGDGYYSHHKCTIQATGHIGYSGPIIHVGAQIESADEIAKGKK